MHPSPIRDSTERYPTTAPTAPAHPTINITPREPEPIGLTQDEIRRIILDLIG